MIVWHDFNGVSNVTACLVGFSPVRSCAVVTILDAMQVMQGPCDIYIYFYLFFHSLKGRGGRRVGGGAVRGDRGE